MAKKKSWFTLVKRFFISDSQSNQEKKEKRKKWVFARLRMKRPASLTAPPEPPLPQQQSLPQGIEEISKIVAETEKKQSDRALSVAIASAAAAEAAIAAARAAAEVVRLTSTPRSANGFVGETEKPFVVEAREEERDALESSAVKIQTAFRGYLARKALRALKGIVTLQAIIRGRAVRRQAVTTLKRLQSIINIQSQVCSNRLRPAEAASDCDDDDDNANNQLTSFRTKMLRMDSYNQRRWDDRLMSKEEADASFLSKKEAAIKRERIKEYWHQHRKSTELERKQVSGRWRYWLEQWVDTQLTKSKELEDLDTKHRRDELGAVKKPLRLKNLQTRTESFFAESRTKQPHHHHSHRRQCSLGAAEESSSLLFAGSPVVLTYMAATESARAKASSPKLRPAESLVDGFSPSNKNKRLSLVSSVASEVPMAMVTGSQQRSPSLKGVKGPVKSNGNKIKDLSFDSECSLSHWNQQQQQQQTTEFR